MAAFAVDITSDDPEVHPQFFCSSCYLVMKRHSTAATDGIPYQHSTEVFHWKKHKEEVRSVSMGRGEIHVPVRCHASHRCVNIWGLLLEEGGTSGRGRTADVQVDVVLQQQFDTFNR